MSNTEVGFLFHPCSHEDAKNAKNNAELSHLNIEEKTITCSYQIEGREDCHLHEVGMIIPQLENDESFSKFKEDMGETEASFMTIVEDIIK